MSRARDLLVGSRLLTLTGPGGCGKTRLAIELVTSVSEAFVGTTSIMPYYAAPDNARSTPQLPGGRPFEGVGFGYDRYLIDEVLRGELGFTGYVNSDTGITTGMPWGVETLTRAERFARAIDAGTTFSPATATPSPCSTRSSKVLSAASRSTPT